MKFLEKKKLLVFILALLAGVATYGSSLNAGTSATLKPNINTIPSTYLGANPGDDVFALGAHPGDDVFALGANPGDDVLSCNPGDDVL